MQELCKKNVKKLQKRFFPYICGMEKLRHGSLFSGIGGFDLAAEWMGWDNVFHCEWNEFGQKVLKHYWPQAESFSDITKTDFTKYYGTVDIITGGFPCQPYSSAGKRKGKEDERHLWPEMCRAIREISPRFVVGENVRGLTNWNGGLVFDEVCAELESLGYQVAPIIIPACALNAPHKRERIWFVAYAENSGYRGGLCERCTGREWKLLSDEQRRGEMGCKVEGCSRERITTYSHGSEQRNYNRADNSKAEKIRRENKGNVSREFCSNGDASNSKRSRRIQGIKNIQRKQPNGIQSISFSWKRNATNSNSFGPIQRNGKNQRELSKTYGPKQFSSPANWESFPTQSPVCGGNDGISIELDGITFPKWRAESVKAYGNAIVPQVAFQIFQALEKSLYL
jgi:DNA (cytosine-5)-methyltransferase 1